MRPFYKNVSEIFKPLVCVRAHVRANVQMGKEKFA